MHARKERRKERTGDARPCATGEKVERTGRRDRSKGQVERGRKDRRCTAPVPRFRVDAQAVYT